MDQYGVVLEIDLHYLGLVKGLLVAMAVLDVHKSIDLEIVDGQRRLVAGRARNDHQMTK